MSTYNSWPTRPRIVVGVDGSPPSLTALRWAVRQAELTGGTVQAVIAWQFAGAAAGYAWGMVAPLDAEPFEEAAHKTVADAISTAVDPGTSVPISTQVSEGSAAQVLLAAADADLLVVGSRGHSALSDALLGSVSQHCVRHARCPVVVVRGSHAQG